MYKKTEIRIKNRKTKKNDKAKRDRKVEAKERRGEKKCNKNNKRL